MTKRHHFKAIKINCFGISLLEFCLTLPIILLLAFSVIDIYRGFYSYAILKDVSKTVALKASKLLGNDRDQTSPERIYNWYKLSWQDLNLKTNRRKTLVAKNVLEGLIPSQCQDLEKKANQEICEKEFAGLNSDLPSAPKLIENIDMIINEIGKQELKAAIPSINLNCSSSYLSNCGKVSGFVDTSKTTPIIKITANYNMPIGLLRYALNKESLILETSQSLSLDTAFMSTDPNHFLLDQ